MLAAPHAPSPIGNRTAGVSPPNQRDAPIDSALPKRHYPRVIPLTRPLAIPTQPETDVAVAERVRAGDAAAFELVFRTHWEALYQYAFRLLRTREAAEEAAQEVFMRVWRNHATWSPQSSVRAYLLYAVRNVSLNRIEHDRTTTRFMERAAIEFASVPLEEPNYDDLEVSDIDRALATSLAEMPKKRRVICEMRLVDGFSYAEIAQRLQIAPKTVETQLARGLKFLRQRMRLLLG